MDTAINEVTSTSAALRPFLSPYMPRMIPPTGRMKKPTPNIAVVIRIALRSPRFAEGSTGKKSLAIIGVMKAKTRKSYHSSISEEHTSELQSRENLVCRLLLEK